MPNTQIVKWGNSLAVRIPKLTAEEAGVGEGDPISIEVADGCIRLRPSPPQVPTLQELVAQITPKTRYPEVKTGVARGKEKIDW
jgi:antitoxin MazE